MNNKKLEIALEKFYKRFGDYNSYVMEELGKVIGTFKNVTPSEAQLIAQQLKYGNNIDEILNKLSKYSKLSAEDIESLLDEVAKDVQSFSEPYYLAKGIEMIPYSENKELKKLVDAIKKTTFETFENLSNTTVIRLLDNKKNPLNLPLDDAYREIVDRCSTIVATGQIDYNSAINDTIEELSKSGVRRLYFDNKGKRKYTRRLDTSVRQNVMEAVTQTYMALNEQVGKDFGADGVEITAHPLCAEDHLPVQGKQLSKEEFEKLQNDDDFKIYGEKNTTPAIKRAIGTWNCGHFTYPIILGVNKPAYTEKQLEEFKENSNEIIEYEGVEYTKYEATQVQRKLETEIRNCKDTKLIAKYGGNSELVGKMNNKIRVLMERYKEFSETAGLDVKMDRLRTKYNAK